MVFRGESLYSHKAPRITPSVMHNMHLSKITLMEAEAAINAAGPILRIGQA